MKKGVRTTTTTAAATATTTVAAVPAVSTGTGHVSKLRRDLLLSLTKDVEQITGLLIVVGGEKGNGSSLGTMRPLVRVPET